MTLFPSFSILGIRRKEDLQQLHVRSIGYIFLSARPIVLILVMVKDNILVQTLSIVGVALSADLYILIDVGLLFIILSKIIHLPYFSLIENSLWRSIGTLLTLVMLLWGVSHINMFAVQVSFTAIAVLFFNLVTWRYVLEEMDRKAIISVTGQTARFKGT